MLFVHGMGEVFSAFAAFRSIDYKDTSYCSIVNSEVMLLMTILIALFAYFGTLLCSCWRAVMERQEDNCCSDRWCNCHMGVIWGAWLPPLNSVIPCDDWSPGRLVPVVQSYNLHQEVSERYGLFFRCSGWYCFHLTSSAYLFRSPPDFPVIQVSEDAAVNVARALRNDVNRSLHLFREIAMGHDLKKFLGVRFCHYIYTPWVCCLRIV